MFGWGWAAVGKRLLKLLKLFSPAPPSNSEPSLYGSELLDSVPSLSTSSRKTSAVDPTQLSPPHVARARCFTEARGWDRGELPVP